MKISTILYAHGKSLLLRYLIGDFWVASMKWQINSINSFNKPYEEMLKRQFWPIENTSGSRLWRVYILTDFSCTNGIQVKTGENPPWERREFAELDLQGLFVLIGWGPATPPPPPLPAFGLIYEGAIGQPR